MFDVIIAGLIVIGCHQVFRQLVPRTVPSFGMPDLTDTTKFSPN